MGEAMKNIVTVGVTSREAVKDRMAAAFRGEAHGNHISFLSVEAMWKTLSPKRTEILRVMSGQGELSIREVARRVGRDVKAVHGDVTALVRAGVIERYGRKVVFPYDGVHVDFMLRMAA